MLFKKNLQIQIFYLFLCIQLYLRFTQDDKNQTFMSIAPNLELKLADVV